jgi:hypothetical protein
MSLYGLGTLASRLHFGFFVHLDLEMRAAVIHNRNRQFATVERMQHLSSNSPGFPVLVHGYLQMRIPAFQNMLLQFSAPFVNEPLGCHATGRIAVGHANGI